MSPGSHFKDLLAHFPNPSAYPFADIARQQEGAYDNEKGANQKQHCSKRNSLIRDLRRAFLELEEKQTKKKSKSIMKILGLYHFKTGMIVRTNLEVLCLEVNPTTQCRSGRVRTGTGGR